MAKTARLDQILLNLGFIQSEDITRALQRQKAHGGRFGMHLVQLGLITEEQLLDALSEQFRIPTLLPREADIATDLIDRMPEGVVAEGRALPLKWNAEQLVLSLVVANPDDTDLIRKIKKAFDARGIRVALSAESLVATLGRRIAGSPATSSSGEGRIALPELFGSATASRAETTESSDAPTRRVLMITDRPSRKTFLPPMFEREGAELVVAATGDEAQAAIEGGIDTILVASDMLDEWRVWSSGRAGVEGAEVVIFSSVSEALLDNPLPYRATIESLKSSVRALADYRCGELGASSPYGLMASDLTALAAECGLPRVATDGLDLALHLLLPGPSPVGGYAIGSSEPFAAFASSLELASRIRFPWPLDQVLVHSHRLYSGVSQVEAATEDATDAEVAAQLLSLVWYRHNHAPALRAEEAEERLVELRTTIRDRCKVLASTELIELYLRLISERGGVDEDMGDRQVLTIGGERIERALTPALLRVGRDVVTTNDLSDAQAMIERRAPAAIVVDHTEFPAQIDKFTRVTKLGTPTLLFVLGDSTDPSLVLNLLDVGADDVFGPPHDFDLVAARINRAIRSQTRRGTADRPAGEFSATFDVFSFLDLIQMLGQGLKSVRIELSRPGERARIYMHKGRLVHAELGSATGESVVHDVISWEDEGEFKVVEEKNFPTPTIEVSTESVLMEGLRRLDESRRGGGQ